jgi:hypothetical protein
LRRSCACHANVQPHGTQPKRDTFHDLPLKELNGLLGFVSRDEFPTKLAQLTSTFTQHQAWTLCFARIGYTSRGHVASASPHPFNTFKQVRNHQSSKRKSRAGRSNIAQVKIPLNFPLI